MKRTKARVSRRGGLAIIAFLAGGSTLTSCDTRFKTAVVDGVENFVFTLLDPTYWIGESVASSSLEIAD